jgi:hypothetical protein
MLEKAQMVSKLEMSQRMQMSQVTPASLMRLAQQLISSRYEK